MKSVGHHLLPVIVVNLHHVIGLEELEVVKEEVDQVALHASGECVLVPHLASAVEEGVVGDGELLKVHKEQVEVGLPVIHGHVLVFFMTVQDGARVKRDVPEASNRKAPLMLSNLRTYVVGLIVKHQAQRIVLGVAVLATGLVCKDAELFHVASSRMNRDFW